MQKCDIVITEDVRISTNRENVVALSRERRILWLNLLSWESKCDKLFTDMWLNKSSDLESARGQNKICTKFQFLETYKICDFVDSALQLEPLTSTYYPLSGPSCRIPVTDNTLTTAVATEGAVHLHRTLHSQAHH